jgi:hypothetical protein
LGLRLGGNGLRRIKATFFQWSSHIQHFPFPFNYENYDEELFLDSYSGPLHFLWYGCGWLNKHLLGSRACQECLQVIIVDLEGYNLLLNHVEFNAFRNLGTIIPRSIVLVDSTWYPAHMTLNPCPKCYTKIRLPRLLWPLHHIDQLSHFGICIFQIFMGSMLKLLQNAIFFIMIPW